MYICRHVENHFIIGYHKLLFKKHNIIEKETRITEFSNLKTETSLKSDSQMNKVITLEASVYTRFLMSIYETYYYISYY